MLFEAGYFATRMHELALQRAPLHAQAYQGLGHGAAAQPECSDTWNRGALLVYTSSCSSAAARPRRQQVANSPLRQLPGCEPSRARSFRSAAAAPQPSCLYSCIGLG